MELLYLGTAAAEAIPGMFCDCRFCKTAKALGGKEYRMRSGAVINGELMIDFSPDVHISSEKAGIELRKIKNIIFTHSHPDHCNAADLQYRGYGYCYFDGQLDDKLHTYGNRAVEAVVTRALKEKYDKYSVDFKYIEPYVPQNIGGYTVTPLSVFHANEDAYIYLIEKDGKRMLYGHDTGIFIDKTFEYLAGKRCDLVSLDCTMGYQSAETGHMGFPANIKVKERLMKLGAADKRTIFVSHHFSHNGLRAPDFDLTYDKFMEMAKPHGFIMSYDGMKIDF